MVVVVVVVVVVPLVQMHVFAEAETHKVNNRAHWRTRHHTAQVRSENAPGTTVQHSVAVQPLVWSEHVTPAGEAWMSLAWLPQSNAPPLAPVVAQVFDAAAAGRGRDT